MAKKECALAVAYGRSCRQADQVIRARQLEAIAVKVVSQ
jgi:hypothetical protein